MAQPSTSLGYVRTDDAPLLPAPANEIGVRGWIMKNLFATIFDSALTIIFGSLALWIAWNLFDWGVLRATWTGADGAACSWDNAGACWPVVAAKFPQWIYGFFPIDQRWRVNLWFLIGALGLLPMLMPAVPYKFWNALFLLVVYPLLTLILLIGGNFGIAQSTFGWVFAFLLAIGAIITIIGMRSGAGAARARSWGLMSAVVLLFMLVLNIDFGLQPVETTQWGGLIVTLTVAVTGMVTSLPLGILLALGRRSSMPVVKGFSVAFIELWRGVPLITVLFMSSVMLPLFMPEGMSFDKLLRALIGVALFTSAYMAEAIRGGLQAIPKGQYEGAMAVGLSYWQMMRMIVLPQALKISIPNIVSNFIALFKDTTLVSIIGIFDLIGIMRVTLKDTNWASPNSTPTAYIALAMLFWVFCFSMSRYSMYTERRLNTGHKR